MGCFRNLAMRKMGANFAPIVYVVPIQTLGYHTAVMVGKDADHPGNLTKMSRWNRVTMRSSKRRYYELD